MVGVFQVYMEYFMKCVLEFFCWFVVIYEIEEEEFKFMILKKNCNLNFKQF